MKQRVISGVFIAVIAVAAGLAGGPVLAGILFVCAMTGYYELVRAFGVHRQGERINGLEISGFLGTILFYGVMFWGREKTSAAVVVLLAEFLLLMAVYVFSFPKYDSAQVSAAFFSFFYAPVLLSFIYRARQLPYGTYIFALILFCSWICDTFAYFSGWLFGKHKLAPVLSPKKTVEGSVGGIAGSALLCAATAFVLRMHYPEEHLAAEFLILGIAGSIISQIGDLAASAIKRNHNVKDYGKLIPGHGGIMDRFDSMIFIAPVIYFLGVVLLPIL